MPAYNEHITLPSQVAAAEGPPATPTAATAAPTATSPRAHFPASQHLESPRRAEESGSFTTGATFPHTTNDTIWSEACTLVYSLLHVALPHPLLSAISTQLRRLRQWHPHSVSPRECVLLCSATLAFCSTEPGLTTICLVVVIAVLADAVAEAVDPYSHGDGSSLLFWLVQHACIACLPHGSLGAIHPALLGHTPMGGVEPLHLAASHQQVRQCGIVGCRKPCHVSVRGRSVHAFCSSNHAALGLRHGGTRHLALCRAAGVACAQPCIMQTGHNARLGAGASLEACRLHQALPRAWLRPLRDRKLDRAIRARFAAQWSHGVRHRAHPTYTVRRVLSILPPVSLETQHHALRQCVMPHALAHQAVLGNTQAQYHGTSVAPDCRVGVVSRVDGTDNLMPCLDPACCVCSIIRRGFNPSAPSKGGRKLRFGRGVYTSSASSKAADPAYMERNTATGLAYMLLCAVVVGNSHVPHNADDYWGHASLRLGPHQDSIDAHPKITQGLCHPETVSQDAAAVLPLYLLLLQPSQFSYC